MKQAWSSHCIRRSVRTLTKRLPQAMRVPAPAPNPSPEAEVEAETMFMNMFAFSSIFRTSDSLWWDPGSAASRIAST